MNLLGAVFFFYVLCDNQNRSEGWLLWWAAKFLAGNVVCSPTTSGDARAGVGRQRWIRLFLLFLFLGCTDKYECKLHYVLCKLCRVSSKRKPNISFKNYVYKLLGCIDQRWTPKRHALTQKLQTITKKQKFYSLRYLFFCTFV